LIAACLRLASAWFSDGATVRLRPSQGLPADFWSNAEKPVRRQPARRTVERSTVAIPLPFPVHAQHTRLRCFDKRCLIRICLSERIEDVHIVEFDDSTWPTEAEYGAGGRG
jgi:hypothetical protein